MATTIVHNQGVPFSQIEPSERDKIAVAVETAAKELAPDVVRIRYDLGEDWSGEAAIFFRVLLSDEASRVGRLRAVSQKATKAILKYVSPMHRNLQWYFNYRSVAEQARLRESSWS